MTTTNSLSSGVVFQSLGGGGGDGGFNVSAGVTGGSTGAGSIGIGMGGAEADVLDALFRGSEMTVRLQNLQRQRIELKATLAGFTSAFEQF